MPEILSTRLLTHIRRSALLQPGNRVAVAVSGGADSVALLRLLLELREELGVLLSVAHFNHKIRGEASDRDEQFVRDLASRFGLEFHSGQADVPAHATHARLSLETAAHELRYRFFEQLLESGLATRVSTAHSLDDQAETVLLKFLRGAWTRGLAGIYPRISLSKGEVVRPLLTFRRSELREYLGSIGQTWHEDASNLDLHHTRNRVRQILLPLIEREFNPGISETLAGISEIARAEQEYWSSSLPPSKRSGEIGFELLQRLPLAVRRRVIRSIAEDLGFALDFQQVEQALALAEPDGPARLELPDGWLAERVFQQVDQNASEFLSSLAGGEMIGLKRRVLRFRRASVGGDYEHRLPVPGEVLVPELNAVIRAQIIEVLPDMPGNNRSSERQTIGHRGSTVSYQDELLDLAAVGPEVTVRNWRPGDRFWPAHTSAPKKVKELLQARHIGGSDRTGWPVATANGEIVWLRGFPVPERLRARGKGLRIEVVDG